MNTDDELDALLDDAGRKWRDSLSPLGDQLAPLQSRVADRHRSVHARRLSFTFLTGALLIGAVAFVTATRPTPNLIAVGSPTPITQTFLPTIGPEPSESTHPASHAPTSPQASVPGSQEPQPNSSPSEPVTTPSVAPFAPSPEPSIKSPLAGFLNLGPADDVVWSPDSRHLAVLSGGNTVVVDDAGTIVASYAGADEAVWEDASHLLLRDLDSPPVAGAPVAADHGPIYEVTLGADNFTLIGYADGAALSGGDGSVAFATSSEPYSFRVWDHGTWSQATAGYPAQWSANGDRLAVLDQTDTGISIEGTPTVLAWPTLATVASDTTHITAVEGVHFNVAGTYLAYPSYGSIDVLDIASETVTAVGPSNPSGWIAWDANGGLVIPSRDNRTAAAYSTAGAGLHDWGSVGDAVVASSDGSTLIFYTNDYANKPPPMELISDGKSRLVDVTNTSGRRPVLAPDGHAFIVGVYEGNDELLLLSR